MSDVNFTAEFKKTDAAKRQAYGSVYIPDAIDSQRDTADAATIAGMAHRFNASGLSKNIDTDHDGQRNGSVVIESYIAKSGDELGPSGAWVVGLQISDSVWPLVEAGKLAAFSFAGNGERHPATIDGKSVNVLKNVTVTAISLVRKGANKQRFIAKSDQTPEWARKLVETVDSIERRIADTEELVENIDGKNPAGRARSTSIEKAAETEHVAKRALDVRQLVSKLDVLSGRLERIWEGEFGTDSAARERELLAKIESVEIELESLRATDNAGVFSKDRSAFHQRGGQSFVVDAGASLPGDSAYAPKSDALRKAEDDIDLDSLKL